MDIVMVACDAGGDLYPVTAVATGLLERGNTVRIYGEHSAMRTLRDVDAPKTVSPAGTAVPADDAACKGCVCDSDAGVMELIKNMDVIIYEKKFLTNPIAIVRCQTYAIVWVEGLQFNESSVELEKKVV